MAGGGCGALLLQLYHHVVLPRDVPGREDKSFYRAESEMTRRFLDAVKLLVPHAPLDDLSCLDAIRLTLSTCGALNVDGKIDKNLLIKELRSLGTKQALILHVTEQNAALLIYQHVSAEGSKSVIFETFETSASCERVLASENALQWDFPGQAVAIPHVTACEEDFQQSLSTFLEQASIECVKRFSAVTYKACAPQPEVRDTPDPSLVTQALMAILEVNGSIHDTPRLRKRVRDTVSFDKAYKPWRRSAFYLTVRVSMQRHLYNIFGVEKGRAYYKVIMCIFISQLLDDALYAIPNEASHCLLQKLGRRLAKLEVDHERGSKVYNDLYRYVIRTLRPVFEKSISSATHCIESNWEAHKRRTARHISMIQHRATSSDMKLTLPFSGKYLNKAMCYESSTAMAEIRSPEELLGYYESTTSLKPFVAVMNRYRTLYDYEEDFIVREAHSHFSEAEGCILLARKIEAYVSGVHDAYLDYPEFIGRQLLNTLELWMDMDRLALKCYPLLADFHPGFDPAMFDVLQLSTLDELQRLHALQLYLTKRCRGWNGRDTQTIFATPCEDSFAVRYYNEFDNETILSGLRTEIEDDAEEAYAAKEEEWGKKSDMHDSKIQEMAVLSCLYVAEMDRFGVEHQVHQKPCRKHRLKWEAKKMSIEILEHPLPKSEPALKAVLFELMCPEAFAAYRDATWIILSSFAYVRQGPINATQIAKNKPLLRQYSGLRGYANDVVSRITLASSTKSYMESHYAKSGFPVTLSEVYRPFGLKLDYYDSASKKFTSLSELPSFAHWFPLKLPSNSPYKSFDQVFEQWPTSNRVLSTQTRCPPEVNVHEYMAWQGLLLGTYSRWPTLLRELGATNLSFSTESTWAAVSRLILQAGPSNSGDLLRDTHSMLHDLTFCFQLLLQVDYRLEAIQKNWREPVQLDILISILLKILECSPSTDILTSTIDLLLKSRSIAKGWCTDLRSAEHEHGSETFNFAIWAAVLCKRTFYPTIKSQPIQRQLLVEFIIASITLQNSLLGKFDTLPHSLRNAVLRDLKSVHSIRGWIDHAMCGEQVLLESLRAFWPVPSDCEKRPTSTQHVGSYWVLMTLSTDDGPKHYIHYNSLSGTLLIDGHSLGILPAEYRRWPIVQELFGSQGLKIFPSGLPGMSLVIDRQMPYGHWVHLGFRNKNLVICAEHQGAILELIPPVIFGDRFQYDLPASLVMECYHWLDLHTGIVEIRQQDPWKSKKSNWRLNLSTRQATRNKGSLLIDPNSDLAKNVAMNFDLFELAYNITVFQPPRGNLRVELKRLELDFEVNRSGLLQCKQLGAVIAESRFQDVGTWYGLKSKLVVRSMKDHTQRSILVPLGDHMTEREGPHVSIVIKNEGAYLRFDVNKVLGRIDCPAEPVMLYYRALWHASTSHFLPDNLTSRTGVEQALQYLQSGAYQPWSPLSVDARTILLHIAKFSPTRVYYPSGLKVMESVEWNRELTITMQDDRYRRTIEKILIRNKELAQFAQTSQGDVQLCPEGNLHLENRALYRRALQLSACDGIYQARDRPDHGLERSNATDMASLLFEWPSRVPSIEGLSLLFDASPVIGGYVRSFDKVQLTDILHADIRLEWGPLIKTVLGLSPNDRFQLTFLFSLLAFSSNVNLDLLRAIISFALIPDMKHLSLPTASVYSHFNFREMPDTDNIVAHLKPAVRPYVAGRGTPDGQLLMLQFDHEKQSMRACKTLAESIRVQWPSKLLDSNRLASIKNSLLDRDEAMEFILPMWTRLVDNYNFSLHIEELQTVLSQNSVQTQPLLSPRVASNEQQLPLYPLRMRGGDLPTLQDILEKDIATISDSGATHLSNVPVSRILDTIPNGYANMKTRINSSTSRSAKGSRNPHMPSHIHELSEIIAPFRGSKSMVHERYAVELEHSIQALVHHLAKPEPLQEPFNPTELSYDLYTAHESVRKLYEQIRHALREGDSRAKWLNLVGIWPRTTLADLLGELRTTSSVNFGAGVKEALVTLGVAVTQYQRLLRLQDAIQKDRKQQIDDERSNPGHSNWSPTEFVDWLLFEIESNMMIRQEQVDVALGTISPASCQNSVLQLLMGKGKTSCILPMVALALPTEKLCRIIVPRALLLQSAQIMQAKLGGLLNREILHLPFSRRTPADRNLMQTYCQLHTHIRKRNGIVLALPEHILSFKLSGLQRLCDGNIEQATMMIKAQAWLDRHARDVLDECDVSLAIRTQLIYPSGSQQTVDGHPLRWQTIQAVLDLITLYLDDLSEKFPRSIEVVRRVGFPFIYFLRPDVEEYLISQIVNKICKGQTGILPTAEFSATSQQDILKFISVAAVDADVTERVINMFNQKRQLVNVVYHLRGLFVHRILLSTLKKRWNVQYGLHPTRDPIAVPYQAKGVPSGTAEWGHPDVAIILTCLSFYYEGLSMGQFKQAIEHVAKSNEPSIEYGLWVSDGVPEAFKNYNAVNVEDLHQLRELHYYVRHKVCLLDFYLNSFVFPQHAKQFSKKLSASGSDLILYDPITPTCRVSGFSGTNDTRHQLPLTIKQNDLPQLAHTNAEVLAYLLEDRNRGYVRMIDKHNNRLSEEGLLQKLLNPEQKYYGPNQRPLVSDRFRILIDAGAQILEYDNRSLAKVWLKIDHEAAAVVYFDEDHRARVFYGKGTDVPLVVSPFAENLDGCLVYIDESHCRGTDLKLPTKARAAVTLGPHLTKDALVQAAMRLRLLGKTQSITFFSPPEVHQSILDLRLAAKGTTVAAVSSVDVIRWLFEQTCNGIEQLEPLYFNQALNYLHRTQAKLEHPNFLKNPDSREAYLAVVRSKEMQSLRQLYEPKHQQRSKPVKPSRFAPCLRTFVEEVVARRKGFQDRGFAIQSSALEEVEQEREMEFEFEVVREVQPPVHFKAFKIAKLHPDIEQLAVTGQFPAGSDALQPMFYALQKTAVGIRHGTITASGTAAGLYLSTQFTRTVKVNEPNDSFLRPCHWLLWFVKSGVGLLLSPEEADALIPILRNIADPCCHLIVYSAPITRRMLQFNDLNFCAIPSFRGDFTAPKWLKVELGIFAGRLYFEWDEHEEIMSYLGMRTGAEGSQSRFKEGFATKPLTFLHEWLAVRRKGQDFEHTPMGFITTGKPLSADHSFFCTAESDKGRNDKPTPAPARVSSVDEEDEDSDDEEDPAKEYMFQHEDFHSDEEIDVFHAAEEELDECNTFFDGNA